MIAQIRSYIKTQIQAENSAYLQINDPIGDDNLSSQELTSGFKVLFGPVNNDQVSSSFTEETNVTVEIYKKTGIGERVITDYDALFLDAINIKNRIINPTNYNAELCFNYISASSVTVEAFNTNDKAFKASIELTIRRDFTLQE